MTYQGYRSSLKSAKSALNNEEWERLRKRAWQQDGILSVSVEDTRFTWPERELLRQFAEKLYGKRRV